MEVRGGLATAGLPSERSEAQTPARAEILDQSFCSMLTPGGP